MFRYAQINSNNVVIGINVYPDKLDHDELILSDTAQIGQVYDGGIFKAPANQEPVNQIETVKLFDVSIDSPRAKKIGNIWWIPKGDKAVITATATGLPNGGLMVMVERVVNATKPIEDLRFIATIKDGVVTLPLQFDTSGNYLITAKRLNEGLARIENAPFRLDFETMEFDVYVPVATA
ncbi:hypothetical protein QDG88_04740 [Pseudoalteromonas piscicida]|uniref:hypothetical protein n=1 Tax=Pseudoalteromonas piscicida TaxID=43662 RepID=UPI0027392B5C|nr:hypothetical protein [Pseudoalteromonas piscicida]MDP4487259.1 hypothetical protein [Pseudoalteromonas piscicida]